MLITEPNRYVAEVHDRMPVLLKPEQLTRGYAAAWVQTISKRPLMNDYLRRRRVSRRVNSSRAPNDDATLIDEMV
jgi:putative SOS response-associated peptidase YedK